MRSSRMCVGIWLAAMVTAAVPFFPAVANAQAGQGQQGAMDNPVTKTDSIRAGEKMDEAVMRQNLGDPREEAAYQAFHKLSLQDADKKIKLGQAFIAKYPVDRYSQVVYEELSQTYYDKQDLTNFYTYSDKGLSLFPDDVPLLALKGWVIPRAYKHDDPDGNKKLENAETYSKHALQTLDAMAKPENLTDQQFTEFKTGESAMAHSGLGLVYFRRGEFENSVKELQTAIQNEANPDQSDYYVLGASFENLNRPKDAVDAFNHCAQIAGSLQDNCKKFAEGAMKEAGGAK